MRFDEPIEWKLFGVRENAEQVARFVAQISRYKAGYGYMLDMATSRSGVPVLKVYRTGSGQSDNIGQLTFVPGAAGTCLLYIPTRDDADVRTADPGGGALRHYVEALKGRLEQLGYMSPSSQLRSRSILNDAYRQLAAADDAAALASVGDMARLALIALADETYKEDMLPPGVSPPKGDNAVQKLRYASRRHLTGTSSNYKEGLEGLIKATWKIAVAFLHRQHATRIEAQICLDQVSLVVDSFAKLVTQNEPHD